MKSDKIKPNPMKLNFIILLITIGLPSIHLFGQSNKSINPIVADTTKQKQRKNTFSLILEVGKSNIFNSLGNVKRTSFVSYVNNSNNYVNEYIKDFNTIAIEGGLSYSFGISINHKLNSFSNKIFKGDSKSFITFKNELLFNSLDFISKVEANTNLISPYKSILNSNFDYNDFNNKSLRLQMLEYSPSIELSKNLNGKTNLILNLGPQMLLLKNEGTQTLPINNSFSFGTAFCAQIGVGVGIKNASLMLRYRTFIAPSNTFGKSKYSNEYIFSQFFDGARFESLNLSTEITF
jgi:hypothetical protein